MFPRKSGIVSSPLLARGHVHKGVSTLEYLRWIHNPLIRGGRGGRRIAKLADRGPKDPGHQLAAARELECTRDTLHVRVQRVNAEPELRRRTFSLSPAKRHSSVRWSRG